MKINLTSITLIALFLFPFSLYAGEKTLPEMMSFNNSEYGIKFLYPKTWEIQTHPDPLKVCDYEIVLRPPSWPAELATAEYNRRYSDFPLQILVCRKEFENFLQSLRYEKRDGEWWSVAKGTDMETENIKGKGWHGIVGDVPFRTTSKTGESGPELILQQAVLTTDKNLCLLMIMEYRGAPLYTWNMEDLLKSVELKPAK